jgi:hypothetical protein
VKIKWATLGRILPDYEEGKKRLWQMAWFCVVRRY